MNIRSCTLAVLAFSVLWVSPACGQSRRLPTEPLSGPVTPTPVSEPATGWKPVEVVSGLQHPWAITWLPDGSALITERPGRLRLLKPDHTLDPTPIAGVPQVFAMRQGGLMDVALDPEFSENRLVYLTYSLGNSAENLTRVARARFEDHALHDLEVIFSARPPKSNGFHFGSRLLFLPDGSLLITVGEGAQPENAQNMSSHLGKILRIMPDGSPATDNPFQARVDAAQEIYSYGHRNPQGIAMHPTTGRIYATEHGPRGGDELNLIEPGKNYGWPLATYGYEYHGPRVSEHTEVEGTVQPLVVWTPCIAPSGLAFYTGDAFPEWKGDLFAGGLVLKQVRRVKFDGDKIVGDETLQFDERIRDVRQGPDGFLYVLTDERNGKLLRIEPDRD